MLDDYTQLVNLMKQQSEIIKKQSEFISRLIRDSNEKENLINALMLEGESKNN